MSNAPTPPWCPLPPSPHRQLWPACVSVQIDDYEVPHVMEFIQEKDALPELRSTVKKLERKVQLAEVRYPPTDEGGEETETRLRPPASRAASPRLVGVAAVVSPEVAHGRLRSPG